nr:optineurin [Misgurnus anguillicaudatus]
MASGSSMMNGDISHPLGGPGPGTGNLASLEETIQQMNTLIKENRELKEALKQTNVSMKERFEGLSTWKEKQKEEKDFLEKRLGEAKARLTAADAENETLKKRVKELEKSGLESELEVLRGQIARLQAEKNDLVALNSELQLKMGESSPNDSFIEIRFAKDEINETKNLAGAQKDQSMSCILKAESEEQTVRQLLQSLRIETDQKEALHVKLQDAQARIAELQQKEEHSEGTTQTSLPCATENSSDEVQNLKAQLMKLVDELKQTQSKLDEAENMKKNLQDRCKDLEQDLSALKTQHGDKQKVQTENEGLNAQLMKLSNELTQAQSKLDEAEKMKQNLQDRCKDLEQNLSSLKTQLGDRQKVQTENEGLKVQMESLQAAVKLEQKKTQDEKSNLNQLKDAYTKLFEDYKELQEENKKREGSVSKEEYEDLQVRFTAAEKALADKQQKIDEMKMEIFQKEKELETISVFKAQAEIYSQDFHAEREAREKIHEEKERLSAQLEYVKKQHSQLQEEMDSLGRQSMSEMQRRHVSRGANPQGPMSPPHLQGARGDWQQQNIPEHVCPKCGEVLPDLDTLQIHIMDCII